MGELLDAWMFGRGLGDLEEHDAKVRAVTPREMRELARKCFDESRLIQAVVRGKT
jgi:predicted Zn-dependent peptidase